jgi:hypothetical protein
MKFRVEAVNVPATWNGHGKIKLLWQCRVRPPEHVGSADLAWDIEVPIKDGKWTGPSVGRNSDGRRFLYFAWMGQDGRMFRRIKLYQDQVSGPVVRLNCTMKDGSPTCSTALLA